MLKETKGTRKGGRVLAAKRNDEAKKRVGRVVRPTAASQVQGKLLRNIPATSSGAVLDGSSLRRAMEQYAKDVDDARLVEESKSIFSQNLTEPARTFDRYVRHRPKPKSPSTTSPEEQTSAKMLLTRKPTISTANLPSDENIAIDAKLEGISRASKEAALAKKVEQIIIE